MKKYLVLLFFVPYMAFATTIPNSFVTTDTNTTTWTLDTCTSSTNAWVLWNADTGTNIGGNNNGAPSFCYVSGSYVTSGNFAQSWLNITGLTTDIPVGNYIVTHADTHAIDDTGYYNTITHFRTYGGYIEEFEVEVTDTGGGGGGGGSNATTTGSTISDIVFGQAIIISMLSLALVGYVWNSITPKKKWYQK